MILGGLTWLEEEDPLAEALQKTIRKYLPGRAVDLVCPFDSKAVRAVLSENRHSSLIAVGLSKSTEEFVTDVHFRVSLQRFVETGGSLVFVGSDPSAVLPMVKERFGKAAWKDKGNFRTMFARTAEATALKMFDNAPSTLTVKSDVLETPIHERYDQGGMVAACLSCKAGSCSQQRYTCCPL